MATKLEQRIAEIAEATGLPAYVGKQGHKDEWFAGCDGIELGGRTAMQALNDVARSLAQRSEREATDKRFADQKAERLKGLL